MPSAVLMPILVVFLLGSVGGVWAGAGARDGTLVAASAAAFIAAILFAAYQMNAGFWRAPDANSAPAALRKLGTLRRNGRLAVLVYAWGALSMVAAYKLTDLYWQHGLQYAAGMALFAIAIFAWVHVAKPESSHATSDGLTRGQRLNLLHGGVAALALAIFLASGKLWVERPDWVANIVFVAGGVGIVALCAVSAMTLRRIATHG